MIRQYDYCFAYKYVVSTNVLPNTFEQIPYKRGTKSVNRFLLIPENAVISGGNIIVRLLSEITYNLCSFL